jgi:anti-anti-sigma factor
VNIHKSGTTVRLAPAGDLDLGTADVLAHALRSAVVEGATDVVLDLRGLEFIGSAGITQLLQFDQLGREEGFRLTIVRGLSRVQRVFELMGLDERLPFVDAADRPVPPSE